MVTGVQTCALPICLVFLETQLASVADRLDHAHLLDVLRRSARKLSPAALAAVADVPLDAAGRTLLAEALAER